MKTAPTRFISLCLLFSLSLSACKKDSSTPPTEEEQREFATVTAESDATADAIFNSVFDNVMGVNSEVGIGGTGIFTVNLNDSAQCHSVIISHLNAGAVFPVRVVVDFGDGCVGRDGRIRKGKVITEYSNRLTMTGATAISSFEAYMVNDIAVEGTHTIANKSSNARTLLETKVAAKLSQLNGDFVEWVSERIITRVNAQLSAIAFNDFFSVTGSASGLVKKQNKLFEWGTDITEPLIKKFTCRWIVDGTVTIKKGKFPVATMDYGSGLCDNTARFTVLGHVREISLR